MRLYRFPYTLITLILRLIVIECGNSALNHLPRLTVSRSRGSWNLTAWAP